MLTNYLNITTQLLQNPAAPTTLYTTALLTNYINIARGQVAGEGRCVRRIGTLPLASASRVYPFSSIALTAEAAGVIHVRNAAIVSGTGQLYMQPLPFEWFWLYNLNSAAPVSGSPTAWAQLGQGASGVSLTAASSSGTISSGNLYVDPLPNAATFTLNLDCVCYPAPLAADADTEAIPYLWTDAVPYYAAYMALMAAQTSARLEQANRLYQLYENFMQRARLYADPDVLGAQYSQGQQPLRTGEMPPQGGRGA